MRTNPRAVVRAHSKRRAGAPPDWWRRRRRDRRRDARHAPGGGSRTAQRLGRGRAGRRRPVRGRPRSVDTRTARCAPELHGSRDGVVVPGPRRPHPIWGCSITRIL